jgi:4-alpha-glucanotransferase
MRGGAFFGRGIVSVAFRDCGTVNRKGVDLPRTSGVLLHPSSLPNGHLDEHAYRFVDWLAAAGQSWWQVLPLGPPDEVGSPYRSASAFAGWSGFLAEPDAAVSEAELDSFVARHPFWSGHWAAFAGPGAIADQVRFEREWSALRAYAAERGVRLVGDLPIYVADGGADHVSHPELFQTGFVAGVPPDAFSDTGQRWGNPLFDWGALRATGYRWWIERFRRTFELVDLTRVDHFRGFVAYWAVPADEDTAEHGRWRRGPGRELFDAVAAELGELPLIAEDLGVITPPVERLRDGLGLPGMAILQFGFDGKASNPHRPSNHVEHQAVYTGTHDNDTIVGWWATATAAQHAAADRELERFGIDEDEPHWALVRLALASPARLAVVPLQDVLGLGSEARMNLPGSEEGNWAWRYEPDALTDELAARLRTATKSARRRP